MASVQLLFYLSCHKDFIDHINYYHFQYFNQIFSESFKTHLQECGQKNLYVCCELVYILRVLANMCCQFEYCNLMLKLLTSYDLYIPLQKILKEKNLSESCLWFLGNIYNFTDDSECKRLFFNKMLLD